MLYVLINLEYVKDEEQWRPLDYPGVKNNMYMISDYGNIRNINTGYNISHISDKDGYITCKLMDSETNKGKLFKVHRLVAYTFLDSVSDFQELQVNHLNGINNDNYYKNLQWVTNEVNSAHKFASGLHIPKQGSEHGMNVYNEDIIHAVCRYIQNDITVMQILKNLDQYIQSNNIDHKKFRDVVYKIKAKKLWTAISKDYF